MLPRKRYDSLASLGSASSGDYPDVNDVWADFASNGRDMDDEQQQQSSFTIQPFNG